MSETRWLKEEEAAMLCLVEKWVGIRSPTFDVAGLGEMLSSVREAFTSLGGTIEEIELPPFEDIDKDGTTVIRPVGKALHIYKHRGAKRQVFLGGHIDTVQGILAKPPRRDGDRYYGHGGADMKAGIVVLLKALQAVERSSMAGEIGWEVLITPDEEVGSPSSRAYYERYGEGKGAAFIFEPSPPGGAFVVSRKGSLTYAVTAHGKAAHAGRDFLEGRSAIVALCDFITKCDALNSDDVVVNVGLMSGGSAANVVAERAMCKVNIRGADQAALDAVASKLEDLTFPWHGVTFEKVLLTQRPPKVFDDKTKRLFDILKRSAATLGLPCDAVPSGGVTDGSTLAQMGIPTLDTMGVVGDHIHSPEENFLVSSLTARAELAARCIVATCQESL